MTSNNPVREQVRERYAAAAVAVSSSGAQALAVVDADQCCAPAPEQNASFHSKSCLRRKRRSAVCG